jgi:hypothetical protein
MTPNRLKELRAIGPFVVGLVLTGGLASPSLAEEWGFVGARYQGMGGAGVAMVDDEHASYWNPGALAFTRSYGAALPVSAQASAEGDVIAQADRVASFLDQLGDGEFDSLIDTIATGGTLSSSELSDGLALAVGLLPGLDEPGQGLVANVNAALLLRYERFSLSGLGMGYFGADPSFDFENLSFSTGGGGAAIDRFVDPATATDRYPGNAPAVVAQLAAIFTTAMSSNPQNQAEELVFQAQLAGIDVNDAGVAQALVNVANATASPTAGSFDENDSGAFVRGLAVQEVGVAYGHPLPIWNERIGLGAQIKYLYGVTFNKFIRYDDIDSGGDLVDELTNTDRSKRSHTASLDLGLLVKPYEWLRLGLSARNVTSPEFDLARDPTNPTGKSKLTLDPQVRAGVAVQVLPNWAIAFDADLTENDSEVLDGFESRIVSLGTELKLPVWKLGLALRGGAYLNTAAEDPEAIALTGGIGLRFFDFNLDVAVGASPQTQEVEAANDEELPTRANVSAMLSFRREF